MKTNEKGTAVGITPHEIALKKRSFLAIGHKWMKYEHIDNHV
jgi:hypothetical protein